MSKLGELFRWIWLETQLTAPPSVQARVIPHLHQLRDTVRMLVNPYLPVEKWQGRNRDGPVTATYAGLGYSGPFIRNLLFEEEPAVTEMGKIPLWRASRLTDSLDGELVIIEGTRALLPQLSKKSTLTLPFQVGFMLDVRGSWEDVIARFHPHLNKNELRFVRKYGYEYRASYDEKDLATFYHTMYLPTLESRYASLASPLTLQEAVQLFRRGTLLLVERDGQTVSGSLCSVQHGVVNLRVLGVLGADEQLMKEGAQGAAWYAVVHWGNRERHEKVDFGGCWPYIEGVFQYKRKWGAAVNVSPRHQNKRIWIKIRRNTAAVSRFLQDNPCVILSKDGHLQALVVTNDPSHVCPEAEARWHKLYATPGLRGIDVRTVEDMLAS